MEHEADYRPDIPAPDFDGADYPFIDELMEGKSQEEIEQAKENFRDYLKIAWEVFMQEQAREAKLRAYPAGFQMEGDGLTCVICGRSTPANESWYDKYGLKCLNCQRALDKRIIPEKVCTKPHTCWCIEEVCEYLEVSEKKVIQRVETGEMKARIIPNTYGKPYMYVFLLTENKRVLPAPPKRG